MSNCLDCPHADTYHDEFKALSKKLTDAIKQFNHGHFQMAIEEMEVVVIRLEQMHHRRMGR
jgi:hypothetical protein